MEVIYALPPRFSLFAVSPVLAGTAVRESLASLFRGTCEANHLLMRSVLQSVQDPRLSAYHGTNNTDYPLYAANHGGKITQDIAAVLEALAGTRSAEALSFHPWNHRSSSKPIVAVDRVRKWCPACYSHDLRQDRRVYDRLAWTVQGVEVCTVHETLLETRCEWCGRKDFSFLRNSDVSGFCPACKGWLGASTRALPPNVDEATKYKWWVARSVNELLDGDPSDNVDFHVNIRTMISALIDRHFDGNGAKAGMFLRRSKSLVSEWRCGHVSPQWGAICQMAYAFQVSVRSFLMADADAIAFSTLTNLPAIVSHERPRRRRPKITDWDAVGNFCREVELGHHPSITRLKHIAERFSFDRTYLVRKFPDLAKSLDAILARRRARMQTRREVARRTLIEDALSIWIPRLVAQNERLSRRKIAERIAQEGISLRHGESSWVLAMAHELARKTNPSVGCAT